MSVFSDLLAMSNKASTAQMFDNMSLDIEQLLTKVWQYFGLLFIVKPLMFTCPLFCEYYEPNKNTKLKGANTNTI